MSPDRELLTALAALRRQWRQRVLLESLAWLALALLVAMLIAMATLQFATGAAAPMTARVFGYALLAIAIVWFLIVPLLRRPDDIRFALYVEERAPELRQSLLSAVQEAQIPEAERASPSLARRLFARTTAAIRPLQQRATIERPRMQRAATSLGALALTAVALFLL